MIRPPTAGCGPVAVDENSIRHIAGALPLVELKQEQERCLEPLVTGVRVSEQILGTI